MARAFKRKGDGFVARLDDDERGIVVGLLEQTHEFLAPTYREPTGDAFDDLVARLGMPRLKDSAADAAADAAAGDAAAEDAAAEDAAPESRDPAMERLLPTANRQDPGMAAEFRRLTEHGLRQRKAANLVTAISALRVPEGDKTDGRKRDKDRDKVELSLEQAQAMVVALTDVRLLLGERLGLETDDDADALQDRLGAAGEDDTQLYLAAYYDFLTWLQESLIQALMR